MVKSIVEEYLLCPDFGCFICHLAAVRGAWRVALAWARCHWPWGTDAASRHWQGAEKSWPGPLQAAGEVLGHVKSCCALITGLRWGPCVAEQMQTLLMSALDRYLPQNVISWCQRPHKAPYKGSGGGVTHGFPLPITCSSVWQRKQAGAELQTCVLPRGEIWMQ